MIIALIILAYVANVFLNRWLNKITYKIDGVKMPFAWFLSIAETIVFLIIILLEIKLKYNFKSNWFTGKHW